MVEDRRNVHWGQSHAMEVTDDSDREAAQRWINDRTNVAVALDDLPEDIAPTTSIESTAYAFLLSSINMWPIPPNLKKKLERVELDSMRETQITCSISMSFYHTLSKRFYGSTYHGYEHPFSIKSSSLSLPIDNLNELVYFHSKHYDPNCFCVIELVLAVLSPLDGSVSSRYGCGWALINLLEQTSMSTGRIVFYKGSPRDLLQLKGDGAVILKQLANDACKTASVLSYTIWRPVEGIGDAIASCINANQIVGAHQTIASLRMTKIDYFDTRTAQTHCIGATTQGNVIDWRLLPPQDTDILASPIVIKASSILVHLPQREEFEKALTSWVAHALPKADSNIINKLSSKFGWTKSKTTDGKGDQKDHPETTITHRRLKIGVHNGYTIINNQWVEVDLLDANGIEPNRLQAKEDIEISCYRHPCCMLLCSVEYTVKTVPSYRKLHSPKKPTSTLATIVVGVTAFSPFDRVGPVTLDLMNGTRCQALLSDPLFSPADLDEPLTLSFDMCGNTESNDESIHCNAKPPTTSNDSISVDTSAKTKFLHINTDCASFECDAKGDCSVYDEESLPDESTITFENSITDSATALHLVRDTTIGKSNNNDPVSTVGFETKSASIEIGDSKALTLITISLHSFIASSQRMAGPESLSFMFKMYSNEEITTDSFALKGADGIAKFVGTASFSFQYDYSEVESGGKLATYLMERELFVEVFDESQLHIGTILLPMHLFLRQGVTRKTLENLSVDIIKPDHSIDQNHLPGFVSEGKPISSPGTGSITLSILCVGQNSKKQEYPASYSASDPMVARYLSDTSQEMRSVIEGLRGLNSTGPVETECIICPSGVDTKRFQAVEDYKRQRQEEGHSMPKDPLVSLFREITHDESQWKVDFQVLNAIQWAREGKKKQLIDSHVKKFEEQAFKIRPWVGQTVLFGPYTFNHQLSTNETLTIEASEPGARLVSKSEWFSRRKSMGILNESTEYLTACDGNQFCVSPGAKEFVPFAFDCTQAIEVTTILVSFVSVHTRNVIASFNLQVQPRRRIDRRFIVPCSENEHLRRTISTKTLGTTVSIRCVDNSSTKGSNCKWSESNENKLQVDFQCPGASPLTEKFYIILSDDNFNSLRECWEFNIDVRTPIYDTICLGKMCQRDVTLDHHSSEGFKDAHVKCFAKVLPSPTNNSGGSKVLCSCEPTGSFQLKEDASNKFHVLFQFFDAGERRILVNMVDTDTGHLVGAWALSVQCQLPSIAKEYIVNVTLGKKKHIKLPFTNRGYDALFIQVSSSNEQILALVNNDCRELELAGRETVYLRFRVLVDEGNIQMINGNKTILDSFLFVRDEHTKSEECFCIRLHVQK